MYCILGRFSMIAVFHIISDCFESNFVFFPIGNLRVFFTANFVPKPIALHSAFIASVVCENSRSILYTSFCFDPCQKWRIKATFWAYFTFLLSQKKKFSSEKKKILRCVRRGVLTKLQC